jgi:hypothetical protein
MASRAAPTPYPVQEAQRRTTMSHVKEPHRSTSFALTPDQLAWLDSRRQHGSLSRSAALRQALDRLAAIEASRGPTITHAGDGNV